MMRAWLSPAWLLLPIVIGTIAACPSTDELTSGRRDAGSGDASSSSSPGVCNDGRRDPNEVCDGKDVGDAGCATAVGRGWTGSVGCAPDCITLTSSTCTSPEGTTYVPTIDVGRQYKFWDIKDIHTDTPKYRGAVFDGSFIYYVPYDIDLASGRVARYQFAAGFDGPTGWESYDVSQNNAAAKGFVGGAFDGRYVYFIPSRNDQGDSGLVARYDSHLAFSSSDAWKFKDVSTTAPNPKGFHGAVFDGRFLYLLPHVAGVPHGNLVRYDTRADFALDASFESFSLTQLDERAKGFAGGVFDGQYVYFVPRQLEAGNIRGFAARYDTKGELKARASWAFFDLVQLGAEASGFFGGAFDGQYVYFVPGFYSTIARYDTKGAGFDNAASWAHFDLKQKDPAGMAYRSAVFDGKYLWVIPWLPQQDGGSGRLLRFDTAGDFQSPDAWLLFDMTTLNPRAKGYFGGAFDGEYIYLAPSETGSVAVRIQAKRPAWVPRGWNASFL